MSWNKAANTRLIVRAVTQSARRRLQRMAHWRHRIAGVAVVVRNIASKSSAKVSVQLMIEALEIFVLLPPFRRQARESYFHG